MNTTDQKPVRDNWGGKVDRLLSFIGYCVGLGNVWRFPYLCYKNGGGAFLVPYFLMLFCVGLPLYFMETAMGQYCSLGVTGIGALSPLFKGVGYAAVMASALSCIYYIMLIAYIIFYLFASMTSKLPWGTCDNYWNTPRCLVSFDKGNQSIQTVNYTDKSEYNIVANITSRMDDLTNLTISTPKSPGEEYWENYVLEMSDGIETVGHMSWKLTLCLLGAWIVVILCVMKGIKGTGKVVYVTATFPYIVLIILLVRGVTLPGSADGLKFYLIPNFEKLRNPRVWGEAASQIFYSLGPAWGILMTYGSYNKFNANCHRDSVISVFTCCFTSVFAGCVIFSVIGFLAHEMNQPIDTVMSSGPGLVFIVYPEALTRMPISPLWSVIFFLMLFTVALDSMFATFETVVTTLSDEFPNTLGKRRLLLTLSIAFTMFLLGLPQVTQAGTYVLTLMDWYIGTFPPMVVAFTELMVISYVYGYNKWQDNIKTMLGFKPNIYWRVTWMCVAPLSTLAIIVFNASTYTPVSYGKYTYPKWAELVGWCFSIVSIILIPIGMVIAFQRIIGFQNLPQILSFPWNGKSWKRLTEPTNDWCPASNHNIYKKVQKAQEEKYFDTTKPHEERDVKEPLQNSNV